LDVVSTFGIERFDIPGINIGSSDAAILNNWLSAGTNHTAEIEGTVREFDSGYADELYYSSSRGPASYAINVLKPNLIAPGVLIWSAGNSTVTSTAPEFSFYRGTSQSSPHVAGAAALLKALHPIWTPAEVESALMMTAVTPIQDYDASEANAFERGAGRVELTAVSRAGLVLDETAAGFRAAEPALNGQMEVLNLAGLVDEDCAPHCTWTRTFRSTLNKPATWNVTTPESAPVWVNISPGTFTIPANGQQTVTITASHACWESADWVFNTLILQENSGQSPDLRLPIAVSGSCDATFLPYISDSE
jgi:Subtilase family